MLEEAGLKWGDIDALAMGVSDGAAAFSRGSFDAWAIYGFPIQRAVATEGARILRTAQGVLSGNYVVTAHVDALADPDRSGLIGKYLTLTQRALGWATTHQREWAQIVAKDIGVPQAYVDDQFRRRSDYYELRPVTDAAIRSQQQVADVFEKAGLLPRPVDVRPLWDNRFNDLIGKGG
jgi:sulfonate transport system substrate-binding protein